jgi:hypothetical protein
MCFTPFLARLKGRCEKKPQEYKNKWGETKTRSRSKSVKKFSSGFRGCKQRQEILDLPYLTLLCDNLKNRMFLQNFFSWPYFGNLLCCSSYPHHSTIPQPNNFIMDCRIRLLGQKRMFQPWTSVFDLEAFLVSGCKQGGCKVLRFNLRYMYWVHTKPFQILICHHS